MCPRCLLQTFFLFSGACDFWRPVLLVKTDKESIESLSHSAAGPLFLFFLNCFPSLLLLIYLQKPFLLPLTSLARHSSWCTLCSLPCPCILGQCFCSPPKLSVLASSFLLCLSLIHLHDGIIFFFFFLGRKEVVMFVLLCWWFVCLFFVWLVRVILALQKELRLAFPKLREVFCSWISEKCCNVKSSPEKALQRICKNRRGMQRTSKMIRLK